jgi:hypothetical protein
MALPEIDSGEKRLNIAAPSQEKRDRDQPGG